MNAELLSLQMPLPEDIGHAAAAGDYDAALCMIEERLKLSLNDMMRKRLELEKLFLAQLPAEYPYTDADILARMRELIPDFSPADLDKVCMDGMADFAYIGGKRMYFCGLVDSLLKTHPGIAARAGKPILRVNPLLDEAIDTVQTCGRLDLFIHMRATMHIKESSFEKGGSYHVHLPIPAPAAQQNNIRVLDCRPTPTHIALESSPQRTVYFEETLLENTPFTAEYSYEQHVRYVDTASSLLPAARLYPDAKPARREDLSQQPPHITFTPFLQSLCKDLKQGEIMPIRIARKFYDFVTSQVMYAYVRPYFLIENGAEYAAVNLRGDCGLQALLFITLCRIAGVPARWQSGLFTAPHGVTSHDWAQFYCEPYGWLPVDCSFGGSARRAGDERRLNFYFGNLDPYRMIANCAYMQPFQPPKKYLAVDPYDNQRGECETDSRGLGSGEYETRYEILKVGNLA
jgi:transglutaminase-like putative cysteine protease